MLYWIKQRDGRIFKGKSFVEYKSKSNIYGKAYDWTQDG
jgi:hypothetical protein